MLSNAALIKIAAWGGLIVSTTGFYLQYRLVDNVRQYDYYKTALKTLRHHQGAVFYLGEPIKDKRFKISDSANNYSDEKSARFCIPVKGVKENGKYYIWAEKSENKWEVTKAELEIPSKPDARLAIIKSKSSN